MDEHIDSIKLLHIVTVPKTLGFFRGQVGYMKARGLSVYAVSSPGEELGAFGASESIPVYAVEMTRRITPLRDLVALWRLWFILRSIRPHLVHSHTPKGGLLGIIAAWLARVPVRIYHVRGLRHMTAAGLNRWLLLWTETLSCRFAHHVLCVSRSIREVVVSERICPPEKIEVLLGGSSNGVDSEGRFNPQHMGEEIRLQVRENHGIPHEAFVIGFIGRIVRDKGLVELVEAWRILHEEYPSIHLLVIGSFEPEDPVPPDVERILRAGCGLHLIGQTNDMPYLYTAMDVVVLPTYREGLPNVPLEAAAMARPVVATCVPGCIDAVADGVTGTLVPPRNAKALADAIRRYIQDPDLRHRHGLAGRERVLRDFRQEAIWEAMFQVYTRILREKDLSLAHRISSIQVPKPGLESAGTS